MFVFLSYFELKCEYALASTGLSTSALPHWGGAITARCKLLACLPTQTSPDSSPDHECGKGLTQWTCIAQTQHLPKKGLFSGLALVQLLGTKLLAGSDVRAFACLRPEGTMYLIQVVRTNIMIYGEHLLSLWV